MKIHKRVFPHESPYSVIDDKGTTVFYCNYEHEARAFIRGYTLAKRELVKPKDIEIEELLEPIWTALFDYRENCMPESDPSYSEAWSDICTHMAWIEEDLYNYHNTEEA